MGAADADRKRGTSAARRRGRGWFAAGGTAGAILASSCCVLPLALVTLGVGGAWIGNLTALEPFKPLFVVATLVFLGLGFRQVYFRPMRDCDEAEYCAEPRFEGLIKTALWAATVLVALAITIEWWAPFFY